MNENLEQIVTEVLLRMSQQGGVPAAPGRNIGGARTLILTENPDDVRNTLNMSDTKNLQTCAMFVGGDIKQSDGIRGINEVYYSIGSHAKARELADRFETFVIAAVSLPTLARLSHFVITDPLIEIAFEALCQSKPVIMDQMIRSNSVGSLPAGIKREFSSLFNKLRSYGIREDKISNYLNTGLVKPLGGAFPRTTASSPVNRIRTRILTVSDLQDLGDATGTVMVSGPYRLTDLAREYVENHNININQQ